MQYWYITGTSSGLGKAIAENILMAVDVVVVGVSRRQTIQHNNYIHFSFDLSDATHAEAFHFAPHDNASKIILINNAGSLGNVKYTGELEAENIRKTYLLNIVTPHILINNFIKTYKHHPAEKVIVNVSSGAASSVYDGWSVYAATKAAMDRMTLCVAKEIELSKTNFKIFSIAPGVMDTDMQVEIRNSEENNFSRKNKFVDLKEKQQLFDPGLVAKKIIEIILQSKEQAETIQRIQL
ncbi:MAG: SDR family NAD(P)-dependent oxidoreductase [Chitinophagales bacterium]